MAKNDVNLFAKFWKLGILLFDFEQKQFVTNAWKAIWTQYITTHLEYQAKTL